MPSRYRLHLALKVTTLLALAWLAVGCGALRKAETQFAETKTPWWNPAKSSALRSDLDAFEREFERLVEDTSDEIAAEGATPRVLRACLLWKTRMIAQAQDKISDRDTLVALLDTWALCLRQEIYLQSGDGSSLFGPRRPQAVAAARQALALVEKLARKYIPGDKIAPLKKQIEQFAGNHPIEGVFSTSRPASLSLDSEVLNAVTSIVDIPLSPFTTVSTIEQGISDLNTTSGRLVGVMQDMPLQMRWQTQVLLMTLEQTPAVRTVVQSVQRISEAPMAVPKEVRAQLETFLESVDRNTSCQSALRSLDRLSTLPKQTGDQVERILATVDRNPTAQSVVRSVAKVSTSAEKLSQTAETLPASLESAIGRSADVVQQRGEALVDHASYRAAQLMILGFVLVALLIALTRPWRKRAAPREREEQERRA